MIRSVITGVGAYLPQRVMASKEFEALVDTTEEWIIERTGIRQRHIAAKDERTSDLGAKAAAEAMKNAGVNAAQIDLVIVATTTPDETLPATAARIQHKLGIKNGAAFDVNAACSGFVYALTIADAMLKNGSARRALVIGAETYSRIVDWKDRGTCILFGDGAGAVVLEAQENTERGILYSSIHADGEYGDLLVTTGGVSSTQTSGILLMQGKEVFRHAVAKMSEGIAAGMEKLGQPLGAIDAIVPHQANWRIMASVAHKLGVDENRVISTVADHANTSAASIPLALSVGLAQKRLKNGQLIALTALGAGLTWGSCIITL